LSVALKMNILFRVFSFSIALQWLVSTGNAEAKVLIDWTIKKSVEPSKFYPIVLWHGMGDTCCNQNSLGKVTREIQKALKNVYVYSVRLDENEGNDRKKGYFGDLNKQVEVVCKQLASHPQLQGGFNAIGFSQGGLFLRAFVERCNHPPVKTLLTLGSPHNGIAAFPESFCRSGNPICIAARNLALSGVYLPFVQHRVVQAAYYRVGLNP